MSEIEKILYKIIKSDGFEIRIFGNSIETKVSKGSLFVSVYDLDMGCILSIANIQAAYISKGEDKFTDA